MGKEPYTRFYGVLIRFQEVIKLQSFKFSEMTSYHECTKHFSPGFLCVFRFMEKKPIRFDGVFVHFSRTYEIVRVIVNSCKFDVSEIIQTNEHKKYVNCDLPVNFSIFIFCFMMKMDHFKQKLFLSPQVSFNWN